jgi:hypothetical protein
MSIATAPKRRVTDDALRELTTRAGRRLIRGTKLTCPGCLVEQDILEFRPFNFNPDYAEELVPPLKCRRCGHIFALRDPDGGVG